MSFSSDFNIMVSVAADRLVRITSDERRGRILPTAGSGFRISLREGSMRVGSYPSPPAVPRNTMRRSTNDTIELDTTQDYEENVFPVEGEVINLTDSVDDYREPLEEDDDGRYEPEGVSEEEVEEEYPEYLDEEEHFEDGDEEHFEDDDDDEDEEDEVIDLTGSPSPVRGAAAGPSCPRRGHQQQQSLDGSRARVDDWNCPICLDGFAETRAQGKGLLATMCGHVFCSVCLPEAILTAGRRACPMCRQTLARPGYHPLHLF